MGEHLFAWDRRAAAHRQLVTQYLGYSNFITALEGLLIGAKAVSTSVFWRRSSR
jgi:hypothetical protein